MICFTIPFPQFKPQRKVSQADEEAADLQAQIKEVVTNNKIVLFMKGTPDTPQCGFSSRVVQILGHMSKSLHVYVLRYLSQESVLEAFDVINALDVKGHQRMH